MKLYELIHKIGCRPDGQRYHSQGRVDGIGAHEIAATYHAEVRGAVELAKQATAGL